MTVNKAEFNPKDILTVSVDVTNEWGYVYEKVVRVLDEESFEITHRLCNTGTRRIERCFRCLLLDTR